MIKLSVCMIVKNEAEVLARALDCVKSFADEIIVVDTGSTDKTKEIALNHCAKVFDFEWCDDFSKARNYSFSLASGDYIMWLDADDVIPDSEQQKICELKAKLNGAYSPDVIMCYYVASTDGNGTPTFYYYRERIIKNHIGLCWAEPVHECITPFGQIEHLDIKIYHKKVRPSSPMRNLKIYQKLEREHAPFSPRALYYYGRELFYNKKYKKSILVLKKFLKSDGWIENKIDACSILAQNYLARNDIENAKLSLIQSFCFAQPRSKLCYELAQIFKQQKDYNTAIFWFKTALQAENSNEGWIEKQYSTFLPALELSVCLYYLGKKEEAKSYHILAKQYAPNSPIIKFNEKFFS